MVVWNTGIDNGVKIVNGTIGRGSHYSNWDHCSTETTCMLEPFNNCNGRGYVNAGVMFYAPGYPTVYSHNSGYAEKRKVK